MIATSPKSLSLFGDFAMRRFESEFALHSVNKTQTADRDRFRPPTFSRHHLKGRAMITETSKR
jgi:hypothetical protein